MTNPIAPTAGIPTTSQNQPQPILVNRSAKIPRTNLRKRCRKTGRSRLPATNDTESSTQSPQFPRLRFTPDAWGEWLFLRDRGPTEIGAFGLSDRADPLRIVRLIVPRQYCTEISVRFDDESLADEFENLAEAGYSPLQFARVWLHTHPGDSATPSFVDEETFAKRFSDPDWAVMGILARSGASYARLCWNAVPQFEIELAVEVDFGGEFGGSRCDDWDNLYRERVIPERWFSHSLADEVADPWWIEAAERGSYEIF